MAAIRVSMLGIRHNLHLITAQCRIEGGGIYAGLVLAVIGDTPHTFLAGKDGKAISRFCVAVLILDT